MEPGSRTWHLQSYYHKQQGSVTTKGPSRKNCLLRSAEYLLDSFCVDKSPIMYQSESLQLTMLINVAHCAYYSAYYFSSLILRRPLLNSVSTVFQHCSPCGPCKRKLTHLGNIQISNSMLDFRSLKSFTYQLHSNLKAIKHQNSAFRIACPVRLSDLSVNMHTLWKQNEPPERWFGHLWPHQAVRVRVHMVTRATRAPSGCGRRAARRWR